jgi:hypothetical protein
VALLLKLFDETGSDSLSAEPPAKEGKPDDGHA